MCTFEVNVNGSADAVVEKARGLIQEAGGTFDGGQETGQYSLKLPLGQVLGTYFVQGNTIGFRIDKKPMLLPCSAIESYLRSRIGG
jgi:hypothetical protein